MIRVALKGLSRRKLRAVLTALAIVIGVAMVSGTFILTDTIKSAFGTVFTQVYKHTDAVVTGKSAISGEQEHNGSSTPSFSEALLGEVRTLPGVAEAQGSVSDQASLVGRDGKVISGGRRAGARLQRAPARHPALQPPGTRHRVRGPPAPNRSRSTPTRPKASTTGWAKRSA